MPDRVHVVSDEDGHLTRRFAAGPATFVVRCPSTAVRDSVEELFVDLPEGSQTTPDTEIVLLEAPAGRLMVRAADRHVGPQSPNGALATVVTSVSRLALDADPGHLHLHCAALSLGKRGVLISAPSGTGKTTLAAALVVRGWSYVSDEAVALEAGSPIACGFPKPLLIKPGGGGLVPQLEAASVSLVSEEEPWWLVPVSALPASIEGELEPSLIVILHRANDGSTDASPVATPLHPADAVVALMGQTMDAERFGVDAAATLGHLAARCRCVAMAVGPLDAAVLVLEELIRSSPERHESRDLDPPAETGTNGWRVTASVRSIMIGERAVVHDTAGGAVVALDEAGTALWRALHGEAPIWWEPETMTTPTTEAFLDQLSAHGLVARTSAKEPSSA